MTERTRELWIDDETIALYADAAKDWNPVHFDDDFARARGLQGRIAHGMIAGSALNALLTTTIGERWMSAGELSLRFIRPCPPGQRITAFADEVEAGVYTVGVRDADGELIIVGEARAK